MLSALKAATQAQHGAVETTLPHGWSALSREHYTAWLAQLAGFHLPMEERLFVHDWAALGLPHAAERRRTELLRADLEQLGVGVNALALSTSLPDVTQPSRALGALYVLEGSKLGGHVLTRELPAGLPRAFLGANGESTGARWAEFCRFAEGRAEWADDACATAVETFAALGAWLSSR